MNKARRNELRQLKYQRRLKNLGLKELDPNRNYHGYKDQGKPCSCFICQPPDRNYNRAKEKRKQLLQNNNL